uniref:Transcription factor TFIIIC triple barrel domain-containing protein n=1 Tax=Amphimedon queenslandica TaxID=400682 RepID=A0A1X7UW57_AMPQE
MEGEEEIVMFELAGLPNPDLVKDKSCFILGLETGQPLVQVGSLVFQGKYEDVFGTGLIFEKSPDGSVNLIGKCTKKAIMKSIPMKHNNKDND